MFIMVYERSSPQHTAMLHAHLRRSHAARGTFVGRATSWLAKIMSAELLVELSVRERRYMIVDICDSIADSFL
jgi:hypothetical protein